MITARPGVLVVDDHRHVRAALARLIAEARDLLLVGMACDGAEAVATVERLRPAVVLMDLRMPVMDGIEATAQIMRGHPDTAVIVLTASDDADMVTAALSAGAIGYLLKDTDPHTVLAAVRRAVDHRATLDLRIVPGLPPTPPAPATTSEGPGIPR